MFVIADDPSRQFPTDTTKTIKRGGVQAALGLLIFVGEWSVMYSTGVNKYDVD